MRHAARIANAIADARALTAGFRELEALMVDFFNCSDVRVLLLARFRALRADGVRALSPALLERIRVEVAARAVAQDSQRKTTLPDALAALREIDAAALWNETAATNCLAFA